MFMSHVKFGCMDGQCCNNVTGDDAGGGGDGCGICVDVAWVTDLEQVTSSGRLSP